MFGAIVIAGSKGKESSSEYGVASHSIPAGLDLCSEGIASIPVLGCSTIGRMVDSIRQAGIDEVSVFGEKKHGGLHASGLNAAGREEEEAVA